MYASVTRKLDAFGTFRYFSLVESLVAPSIPLWKKGYHNSTLSQNVIIGIVFIRWLNNNKLRLKTYECIVLAFIGRFRLDQNSPSPFSSFTKHAHSLPLFSHHAVGRNDLPKRVSHSSNGIGLFWQLCYEITFQICPWFKMKLYKILNAQTWKSC